MGSGSPLVPTTKVDVHDHVHDYVHGHVVDCERQNVPSTAFLHEP
jgi:hypothetical protein